MMHYLFGCISNMMNYNPVYGIFGMIFWFLIIIGIIYFIIWVLNENRFTSKDDTLEILKRRYAKGEVTKKQFEEMKKELR